MPIARIPDEELKRLYVDEQLSSQAIAKMLGYSFVTVAERIKRIGVMRTRGEATKLSYKSGRRKPETCYFMQHGKPRTGGKAPKKEGDTYLSPTGYVFIYKPQHPRAIDGYVREHILVWEEHHEKPLPKNWEIHHLNGIKTDNRPQNLAALTKSDHAKILSTYKKRIRELEIENRQLRRALDNGQMLFVISEN